MWVAEAGINIGDKVIVEGLQKVRAGVEVKGIEKKVDPLTGIISDLKDSTIDSSKAVEPNVTPSAQADK
jgi:membrane fusion protein (multidrug efflux system)